VTTPFAGIKRCQCSRHAEPTKREDFLRSDDHQAKSYRRHSPEGIWSYKVPNMIGACGVPNAQSVYALNAASMQTL
jgi:hypothetical protein